MTRLTGCVRELLRQGRGRSQTHTIETLNPVLRGWIGYFPLGESKGLEEPRRMVAASAGLPAMAAGQDASATYRDAA